MNNFTNKKYNFFLFIQQNMRHIYTKNYLNNNDNVYFFNNNNSLKYLLKQLNITYIVLSVDLGSWFDCIDQFNPNNIYYIGHGITNPCISIDLLTPVYKDWITSKINLLILCKSQYETILPHKKNVFKIGTIPQIDNFIFKKEKTNSILIVDAGNLNLSNTTILTNIRSNFLKILHKYFNDIQINYRGYSSDYIRDNEINKYSNINNITHKNIITCDYYDADIFICFTYGTAFLEGLLNNSKTLLFITNKINKDTIKYKIWLTFDKIKYPNLLVSDNLETFDKHLNILKNNPEYFNSEEYLKDKNLFIKDCICEYIPDIGKQLIDIIEKNEITIN